MKTLRTLNGADSRCKTLRVPGVSPAKRNRRPVMGFLQYVTALQKLRERGPFVLEKPPEFTPG